MESASKRSTGARERPDIRGELRKTTFFRGEGGWDSPPGQFYFSRSNSPAAPMPPPMHMETTP